MTEPMLAKGTTTIKGFRERLRYALKVLITGKIDIEMDVMVMFKQFIGSLDRERAHKLRKLTQKIERKA